MVLIACSNDDDQAKKYADYPSCFQEQINQILQGKPRTPRSNIKEYNYNNQEVYVLEKNGIADEQFTVVNNKCDIICSYGGIAGNQNNSCINWEDAKYIETVWEDER